MVMKMKLWSSCYIIYKILYTIPILCRNNFFLAKGKQNLLKKQLHDVNNIVIMYSPNTQTQVFTETALLLNTTKFW